jgi:general nucleoside transport system permease protein
MNLLNRNRLSPAKTGVILAVFTMVLLASARMLGDANALTGSGAFGGTLGLAVPVALAGLGGLLSERVGIVNIGLQGMMTLGTWGAGFFGWKFGPWGALVGGAFMGALGGGLHALASIRFGVDQAVSGVAINLLAPGITRFLSSVLFNSGKGLADGGSLSDSPPVGNLGKFTMPFISGGRLGSWRTPDPLFWLEKRKWFFVADVASLIRGVTRDLAIETIILLALFPLVTYIVWRTPLGLRLRSSGEKPSAADSLGVNVTRLRWGAVIASGALAGLGGSWLVTNVGKYSQGQEGLRGFLGLAAVIFGNWKPVGILAGALLFAFPEIVRQQIGDKPARAFVLAVGIGLAVTAVWQFTRKATLAGSLLVLTTIGTIVYFLITERVDDKLASTFPYIITLLVLLFSSDRLRPPAAAGIPWSKGQST